MFNLDGSYRLPNDEPGHLFRITEVPSILRKYPGTGNLKIRNRVMLQRNVRLVVVCCAVALIRWKGLVLIDCRFCVRPPGNDTEPFIEVGEGRPVDQARLGRRG